MNETTDKKDTSDAKNISESTRLSITDVSLEKMTPAMRRYLELKREYHEYLLFYRMGDFYELFFEDAITTSGALGLALTSRSKIDDREIPMCGVPFHAYEIYMARLIKMGYKVAICEQMEDPAEAKKRGSKEVVRREVVRLVTSGTLTEDTLLNAKQNNYIAAVHTRSSEIGIAWLDISTGAFYTQQLPLEKTSPATLISNTLARLSPAELLLEDKLLEHPEFFALFGEYRDKLSMLHKSLFNIDSATNTLLKAYKIQSMQAYGDFSKAEIIAAGVLLEYVENTQKGHLPRLSVPVKIFNNDIMEIDAPTRRSLELLNSNQDNTSSLLKTIDRTVTGIGGRLFAERLAAPTRNIREINDRLDAVSFFVDNPNVRQEMRNALRKCSDMERAVQRLSIGRGGPKDLYDLAQSLKMLPHIQTIVTCFANYQKDSVYTQPPQSLKELAENLFDHSALQYDIETTLLENRDDLPTLPRAGGFIRKGVYADLDYLKNIRQNCQQKCDDLKNKYIEKTGVSALKIKNNSVIGYFVEVPIKFADKLLNDTDFIHRQSVLNAVRFTTLELSALENEVNSSEEKALELEQNIFNNMVDHVLAQGDAISRTASVLAKFDVSSALAELATEQGYTRPLVDESLDFEIIEGRHPVVEAAIKREGSGSFVSNSCFLTPKKDNIWLITGPNMAGKSTFLRQNALIAIMAQMGSFVPAQKAKIGIIDKLFSRVGASDDLAHGRSTFMVEMVETAAILNRSTEHSFVILDEIGRGTATFDGLSIAWAVVEHLAEINKCRTLFATHYHELTKLENRIKNLSLHCIKTKEFNNDVIFMHEVVPGSADRSYGIHVAKLAGMPDLTIKRAKQVLALLEKEKQHKILNSIEDELPLFQNLKQEVIDIPENPTLEELKKLDIDALSPREALDKLYELKQKALL